MCFRIAGASGAPDRNRLSLTGILFTCAFLSGCLLALVRHPIYGAMTYSATFFLSPQMRWWGQGAVADVRWSYAAAIATALALLLTRKATAPAIPTRRYGIVWALALFVLWLAIQYLWALAPQEHVELLTYYIKFFIALVLIYRCVDSEQSLRLLLWAHVGGTFYLGWVAFTSYSGGRFEDFGGAGLSEANSAALAIVTGIFVGSALFLAGSVRARVVLLAMMPFIVNALVATISRSGFLALGFGGLAFNWLTPRKLGSLVRALSVLAVVMFLMLTGPAYWKRMHSIEEAGQNIEGVNTGEDRLAIMRAQWRMFVRYPFGCGATCTAVLSPEYLSERYLAVGEPNGRHERASHNTFLTMLVEHGIPGVAFYLWMLWWTARAVLRLGRGLHGSAGFMAAVLPGIAAVMAAITIGDQFVSYMKFEIRFWFVAVLMAMLALEAQRLRETSPQGAQERPAGSAPRAAPAAVTRAAPPAPGGSETRSGLR